LDKTLLLAAGRRAGLAAGSGICTALERGAHIRSCRTELVEVQRERGPLIRRLIQRSTVLFAALVLALALAVLRRPRSAFVRRPTNERSANDIGRATVALLWPQFGRSDRSPVRTLGHAAVIVSRLHAAIGRLATLYSLALAGDDRRTALHHRWQILRY
jgi:hypothetical protein